MTNRLANPELAARLRGRTLAGFLVLILGVLGLLWTAGATFTADEASAHSSHRTPSTGFAARIEAAIR